FHFFHFVVRDRSAQWPLAVLVSEFFQGRDERLVVGPGFGYEFGEKNGAGKLFRVESNDLLGRSRIPGQPQHFHNGVSLPLERLGNITRGQTKLEQPKVSERGVQRMQILAEDVLAE